MTKLALKTTIGTAVLLAAGTGITANILTAPGVKAYGENINLTTSSTAFHQTLDKVKQHQILINNKQYTLEQLGYTLTQSEEDFKNYKTISSNWNKAIPLTVKADKNTLQQNLAKKDSSIINPSNASLKLDSNSNWTVTPGKNGKTVNIDALTQQLNSDLTAGNKTTSFSLTDTPPVITDVIAKKKASELNQKINSAVLKLSDGKTIPLSPKYAASFMKVNTVNNVFTVSPDKKVISEYTATLPSKLNKKIVGGKQVVDENGKNLRTLVEAVDGVTIASPVKLSKVFVDRVENSDFVFPVEAIVVKAPVEKLSRRAEVNLTTKHASFFENGKLVFDFPVGVGRPGTPTDPGDWRVASQLTSQDMGCSAGYDYCVKGVRWISYFHGGEAFHAAPWANSFGQPDSYISHGCVGMRMDDADKVYHFLEVGSPVKVHF